MEITQETPINFIVLNFNIDKKNLYNKSLARMCMDSWKRAFPNLNIINIDVTEEIASMNEFSKLAYKNNMKNYIGDPIRLYYISQYDNCVYCDYDVFIDANHINDLLKLMNENNEFIISNPGTFIWNKHKENQKFIDFFNFYNEFTKAHIDEISTNMWNFTDGYMEDLYNVYTKITFINPDTGILGGIYHINVVNTYLYSSNKIFIKYNRFFMFFIKFKFYELPKIIPNNIIYLQNRNFN